MTADRSGAIVREQVEVRKHDVADDGSRRLVEIVRAERRYGKDDEVIFEQVEVETVAEEGR